MSALLYVISMSNRKKHYRKSYLPRRNSRFVDTWSFIHLIFGIVFGLIFSPLIAVLILIVWEPIEIFIISPILARHKIVFGYETLNNSFSDILFDIIGVLIAVNLFRQYL
jgi:hypothetical protein